MATPILLPKLDMTMTEGTISRWHKQEGDEIRVGDLLFEVEADKLNMDIDAPAAGVLRGVVYEAGARLPVGTVIAYILAEGESLPEGHGKPVETAAAPAEPEAPAAAAPAPSAPAIAASGSAPDGRVRATPAARRLAREHGVDLAELQGSGPNGRIHADDVLAAAPAKVSPFARKVAGAHGLDAGALAGTGVGGKVMKADVDRALYAQAPAADPVERVALSGVRGVIARRMSESWQQAPHVTLTLEADCAELVRLRSRLTAHSGAKISYNTLVCFFTAKALTKFPALNATWDGPDLLRSEAVHLAIAVDAPNGLMVPVVRNAERLGLERLGATIEDVAGKAREGGLTPGDMAGGTFTVSNLGGFGIEAFTPIINQPQVAILGVGAIVEKVVPVDGAPAVRPRLTLSLSFDHRALDGADGARFLAHLRSLIEYPEQALL